MNLYKVLMGLLRGDWKLLLRDPQNVMRFGRRPTQKAKSGKKLGLSHGLRRLIEAVEKLARSQLTDEQGQPIMPSEEETLPLWLNVVGGVYKGRAYGLSSERNFLCLACGLQEMLTGKPLFPGKNMVHQLELMTDFLGTTTPKPLQRNEKARRYLSNMREKPLFPYSQKFPHVDPFALRLLAFDPKDRPSVEEALSDSYFHGLSNVECEPSTHPASKVEFEFERRKLAKEDVRELIYREMLEYHSQMLREYLRGGDQTSGFMYPGLGAIYSLCSTEFMFFSSTFFCLICLKSLSFSFLCYNN